MTGGRVIANASPLIALHQIGQLELLQALFASVVIPPAVAAEVRPTLPHLPAWVSVEPVAAEEVQRVLHMRLGAGESQAIALALSARPDWLLLDERAARRQASGLGLAVIGTLGVLAAARRRGLVAAVGPLLEALESAGFRLSSALARQMLDSVGESVESL